MRDFKPRAMMEKAIDAMRMSIAESRSDGKVAPKVGAVLVDVGDEVPSVPRIMTAYRGELREGDHAEYTLLERKNRDRDLSNCVLFATLEPCAPNARKHPKLGCAERIVLARIREVWVGIEDPDPTVDRKGIKYLQENGVKVNMFDRDLQEIVIEENRLFMDQALERRADAEEKKRKQIESSTWEAAQPTTRLRDFSPEAMEAYRSRAKITDALDSPEFQTRLERLGLLIRDGEQLIPTGFGMLLFGSEPREMMPQAGLLATIHYADGTEEPKDFDGPLVLVPSQVIEWLRDKLPNVIDRSEVVRQEKGKLLFELVREGVVNALVHRDYDISGAKCQLVVTQEKIEIRSPGKPVDPITLEQMQSFEAPMLSRNPTLHYVFAKLGMAEERGLGLKSMKERASKGGLPLPRYEWRDPYLTLTLFPSSAGSVAALPPKVVSELSEAEQSGWQWLTTKGIVTSGEYADAMDVNARTARRHLQQFANLGLVRVVGAGRGTRYEVT